MDGSKRGQITNSDGGFGVPSGFVWKTKVFPRTLTQFQKIVCGKIRVPCLKLGQWADPPVNLPLGVNSTS